MRRCVGGATRRRRSRRATSPLDDARRLDRRSRTPTSPTTRARSSRASPTNRSGCAPAPPLPALGEGSACDYCEARGLCRRDHWAERAHDERVTRPPTASTAGASTPQAFYAAACDPRAQRASSRPAPARARPGCWSRASLRALLDGAAAAARSSRSPSRARPPARCASGWTSGCAEFVDAALDDDAARRGAASSAASTRRGARRSRRALGALHGRVLAGGRAVEIRTFHGWFAQLLRAAPLALLAEPRPAGRHAELIEDAPSTRPAVPRASTPRCCATPRLRADYTRAGARGARPAPAAQVARRGAGTGASRSSSPMRPACSRRACRRGRRLWPELAALEHPAAASCDGAGVARRCCATLARALGRGARQAAQDAADGLATRARRWPTPRPRFERRLVGAVHAQRARRAAARATSPALAERCRTSSQRLGRCRSHQHERAREHLRMVRLGARAARRATPSYKRSAAWPTWPTSSACALALLRDGELSGWVQERLDARVAPPADRRVPGHEPAAMACAARLAVGLRRRGRRRERAAPAGRLHRRRPEAEHLPLPPRRAARVRGGARVRARGARRQRPGLRPHAAQRAAR